MSVRAWLVRAGGRHLQKELALPFLAAPGMGPLDSTPPSVPSTPWGSGGSWHSALHSASHAL